MPDQLNDLARQTRISVAVELAGAGLIVGGLVVAVDHLGLGFGLMVAGLAVTLGWALAFSVWARRSQRDLVDRLRRGTEEVVGGRVTAEAVPGRVVRRRVGVAVATVLEPDRVHRRAFLVPPHAPLLTRGSPVVVGLHPDLDDVAVLVTGASPEQVAAAGADPRWRTARVPRDRDVVGGWGAVALAGLGGFAVTLAVSLGLGALAG